MTPQGSEAARAIPRWDDSPAFDTPLGQRLKCLDQVAHLDAIGPLLTAPGARALALSALTLAYANYRAITALEQADPQLAAAVAKDVHAALSTPGLPDQPPSRVVNEAWDAARALGMPVPHLDRVLLLLTQLNDEGLL